MSTHQKILLLEDVEELGRKGDIVRARNGYVRNFLFPQKRALIADANAIRIQEQLQEQRRQQAIEDKKVAEEVKGKIDGVLISTEVKVDPEGHMYGSVTAAEVIALLLAETGVELEKKALRLFHPVKQIGVTDVVVLLKEGVTAEVKLKVIPEGFVEEHPGIEEGQEEATAEEEAPVEEEN